MLTHDEESDAEKENNPLIAPHARLKVPHIPGPHFTPWTMQLEIEWFAHPYARRVMQRLLAGRVACAPRLVDGWRLSLMRHCFLEQSYLASLTDHPAVADLVENVSLYDAVRYWDLTIAATGFFYFGYLDEWKACAAFYPMLERRSVITDSDDDTLEHMQCALIRFLAKQRASAEDLEQLASVEPFGPLSGTWENNDHFAQALNALCDWHIGECHTAVRGHSRLHSPYDLLPLWILAIARKRERAIGRMCLPHNDLMTIAQKFSNVPANVPPSPTILEVRAL